MKELKEKMTIAMKTHKKQSVESKGLYEKELARLEVEFQMLEAQLEKAEESYEDMKKTHQRAVEALNALNNGEGDWTFKLLADNAKLAIEASEIQCKKFEGSIPFAHLPSSSRRNIYQGCCQCSQGAFPVNRAQGKKLGNVICFIFLIFVRFLRYHNVT